jgi:hypothetical protein
MILTTEQTERIHAQTGLSPMATSRDIQQTLENYLGRHTFYSDPWGIYVWEPLETLPSLGVTEAQALQVGRWVNESQTTFVPHAPEPTESVVVLPPQTH